MGNDTAPTEAGAVAEVLMDFEEYLDFMATFYEDDQTLEVTDEQAEEQAIEEAEQLLES